MDEPLQVGDIVWINGKDNSLYELLAFTDDGDVILCETNFTTNTVRYWSWGSWAYRGKRFYAEIHHLMVFDLPRGVVIYG